MDKIRVYEAAKKLNIKTKELINLLLSKGIAVKSPISFISQRDFESLLSSMTAPGKNVKTKTARAKKKKRAVKAVKAVKSVKSVSAPKKKNSKLSLVPPLPSDEAESQQSVREGSAPEPEKKIGEKAEPEKKKHKLPRKHESVKSVSPAPLAPPVKPRSSVLSYLSFAMAAIALLITFVLSSNVSNNTSSVSQINQTVSQTANALKAELAGVNDGIRINQDLIFENRDSIANVLRVQTRIDLSKQSAALKELAPSLPAKISTRILDISKGMNSLASSL